MVQEENQNLSEPNKIMNPEHSKSSISLERESEMSTLSKKNIESSPSLEIISLGAESSNTGKTEEKTESLELPNEDLIVIDELLKSIDKEVNETTKKEENIESSELSAIEEVSEITATDQSSPVIVAQQPLDSKQQITLIQKGDLVYVSLPLTIDTEYNQWQRIIDDFNVRLRKIEKSWQPNTKVHLQTQDRLLDTRQIQDLNSIFGSVKLRLDLVITKRRQTAVAAASAGYSVQQESPDIPLVQKNSNQNQDLAEPLYLKNTIRSGEEICHPSSVIIFGDVNPGANIIAHGEIIVWGTLKGIAHAGATGNRQSVIMALRMEPTQVRIADLVARAPENALSNPVPEVAYVSPHGIRIRGANNFVKTHNFVEQEQYWVNQRDMLNLGFS